MTLTERLSRCYTGAIYDVMRARGLPNCILPRDIRAIDADTRVAGPVFTMRGIDVDPTEDRDHLLDWVDFLGAAPAGHVVICQPQNDRLALMGELSAETLQFRGVLGYIVDGGSRDNGFVRRIGFPVFARFQTPRDIVGLWRPEALDVPITIGGVLIRPGDFVLADIDGCVIIPSEIAEEVVAAVEAVMATEDKVRAAILSGIHPREAYLTHGKF
jgi:regulator of RNase E activity RraA